MKTWMNECKITNKYISEWKITNENINEWKITNENMNELMNQMYLVLSESIKERLLRLPPLLVSETWKSKS